MDVYLLPRGNGQCFLYTDDVLPSSTNPPAVTDPFSKKALAHARRAVEWASERRRRREHLLRSLSAVERVRVHFAAALSEDHARAVYDGLLAAAIRKHRKWMVASVVGIPVSIPLTLMPGPNLVLGYLAWRSVSHYRSRRAGQRAAELPVELIPNPVLSELLRLVERRTSFPKKPRIRALGQRIGLADLDLAY